MFYIEREQTDGSAKHTNANVSAIRHVTSDATTDAKITWLSTHQRDDQRDMWGATTDGRGPKGSG